MGKRRRHYSSTSSTSSSSSSEGTRIRKLEREVKRLKKYRSRRRERREDSRSPSGSMRSDSEPRDDFSLRPLDLLLNKEDSITRSQPQNNIEYVTIPEEEEENNSNQLNASILSILGYEEVAPKKTSPKIHGTIAAQWGDILKSGMTEDKATELANKYPPIENCPWVEAPKLNPEVNIVVHEQIKKRDARMQKTQNKIGAAITAIAQVLNRALEEVEINKDLIEGLSDAGKLLSAVHFEESSLRRGLIYPGVNDKLKETLSSTAVDGFLYGHNLSERIKETKALEKASEDLKINRKSLKQTTTKARKPLNSRGLPPAVSTHARSRQPEPRKRVATQNRANRHYQSQRRQQRPAWKKL